MATRHVLLVGFDGLQLERLEALLISRPKKSRGYQQFVLCRSFTGGVCGTSLEQDTMSGPGWATVLTGVWSWKHRITSNNDKARASPLFPSLFHRLVTEPTHTSDLAAHSNDGTEREVCCERRETYCFCAWPTIQLILGIDQTIATRVETLPDKEAVEAACHELRVPNPSFIFVHLDDIDETGHSNGFGPKYDAAILHAGEYLQTLLTAVRERIAAAAQRAKTEEWLIMIVTDHGRAAPKGRDHGGQSLSEKTTFVGFWLSHEETREKVYETVVKRSLGGGVFSAPNIFPSTDYAVLYRHLSQACIAPTVLEFLQIHVNTTWRLDGRSYLMQQPSNMALGIDCAFVWPPSKTLHWGVQQNVLMRALSASHPAASDGKSMDTACLSTSSVAIRCLNSSSIDATESGAQHDHQLPAVEIAYALGQWELPCTPGPNTVWDIQFTQGEGTAGSEVFWTRVCGSPVAV